MSSKVSVKNIQETFENISTSSVKAHLKPESSVDQSSDSHTTNSTVKQILKSQESDNDSDHEISSLHERPKSNESLETSESDFNVGQMKRSGTDSSDYELHSTVVLDKPEMKSREVLKMESESDQESEHKPLPTDKHQQKINSTELLQRQIKDDMYEQVLSQEDDSVMSESTIETNIFQQKSDPTKSDDKFLDSAISLGRSPSSNDALEVEGDSLAEYEMSNVHQAEVSEVVEPDWEILTSDGAEKEKSEPECLAKRSMTPEQALELATEIVQNVQSEAIRKYEDLVKSNELPKPQPDSKFTIETKEKVEEYLKEMEESEQYDQVAAELIHKVVSKKEEMLKQFASGGQSIDITDDEEHKSETMLNELKRELRRTSVSVTDEDLITDMTSELLQEKNIEEIKQHLEEARERFRLETEGPSEDFKFQTSFRTHFVREEEKESNDETSVGKTDGEPEDLLADDSSVVLRREVQTMKDRRAETDSVSGSSQTSGSRPAVKSQERKSDPEGYSSAGESFFSAPECLTSSQSRPTSSDVEALLSAMSERSLTTTTTENSEFLTAQDHSSATSHYYTAGSTLSHASESSGHLASIEVSECSETLVESSLEYEQRQEDGSDTPACLQQFDDLSCDELEPGLKKSPVDFSTVRRSAHARNSSVSFFDPISPGEIQCLSEDDVDGNCFSGQRDEEKESLIQDNSGRFPIPDLLASKLSESRETLSSSVITLSNVSDATILEGKVMQTSTATLDQYEEQLGSSVTTMSSSSHSSWSTNVNHSPPKGEESSDLLSARDDEGEPDPVFQEPRARDSEGAQPVQPTLPQEISVDFGSDYDSRPNSELKDVESRPISTDRMSRTSSTEALHLPVNGKRSYSIDDTVSDGLRVLEPFTRPKSPMPQHSTESGRNSSDSEERKMKISASSVSAASPGPGRQCLNSTDTLETELAFSQHFTQVFDETDFEPPQPGTDLTPDSMETSQGEEFFNQSERKPPGSDHDDLLVGSPPLVTRPLGVKYWPPLDNLEDQELDAVAPLDKRTIARSESEDNSENKFDLSHNDLVEKDLEDQKKWLENQFDGNQNVEEYSQYGYGQPLDQILEEEEDRYSHSSEDIKELQKFKESLSSTPDFEQIVGKRQHISRSGEQDDLSMGSLTEFERLEREVALESVSGSGSHGSLGSNDSLEVSHPGHPGQADKPKCQLVTKVIQSKSGTGDDVSVDSYSSLKSFELMEAACKEAELIEKKAKHQEEVLSEIEEGHESQESEAAETISELGEDDRSEEDYEDRLFEIDSIIKQAQANVEKFDKDKKPTDEISLKDIMGRPDSRTESVGSNDSLEVQTVPDLPKEPTSIIRQSSLPTRIQSTVASRTTSVSSLRSATSTVTQFDPESIRDRDGDLEEFEAEDLMAASLDSLDLHKHTENTMITSTDSLEAANKKQEMVTSTDSLEGTPRKRNLMTISTDSIESSTKRDVMSSSVDSLEGDHTNPAGPHKPTEGAASMLLLSTDSIETSSTNTRATASMLSSFTSQGSETLVADDEFEHDNSEDSRSLRRQLMEQGNLQIDDSDDSATYSHASPSPHMKHKLYSKETKDDMIDSIEEVLETEEIDEKGNIIVKKVIQKRIIKKSPKTVRISENKNEGYISDLSEKRDDSCEETIEEVDEFGNERRYIVKRTLQQSDTLGVIQERRQNVGLSSAGEIFKNVTEVQSPQSVRRSVHHTEQITKVFDAPTSTPSPPASPPKSAFRSQIPIRKP